MADIKWIKLSIDIFDNRKIKQIEKMPDGDTIIVIWVKILCLAGNINDGGLVYFTKDIAYTDEMLATEFCRPINTVRLALQTFVQFNMIEIVDNIICLTSWEKYQSIEKLEKIKEQGRKRVASYRANQKQLMSSQVCQYCGREATGYDHIVAISRGGKNVDENKVPCCAECNRIKNDKPIVDFLNNNRNRINDEIISKNQLLSRHVTLCNVTDRYSVTQCNATELELELELELEQQELDIELDNNIIADKPQKRTRFIPPTVDEVKAYCEERKNGVDYQRFIDYYTANGWKVGKNPMRDWKATVRTWENNDKKFGNAKPIPTEKDYTIKPNERGEIY